jgi:hypothetical protein
MDAPSTQVNTVRDVVGPITDASSTPIGVIPSEMPSYNLYLPEIFVLAGAPLRQPRVNAGVGGGRHGQARRPNRSAEQLAGSGGAEGAAVLVVADGAALLEVADALISRQDRPHRMNFQPSRLSVQYPRADHRNARLHGWCGNRYARHDLQDEILLQTLQVDRIEPLGIDLGERDV